MIAAASDLKFALEEIARGYRDAFGQPVRISYGSSGNFFRQITQGAPFELFLCADEEFVARLFQQRLTADEGVLYAVGRLVLYAPAGAPFAPDEQMADLRRALLEGRIAKFAVANPEHAPYGRAAMQALQKTGLWNALQPKLVLGENVSQAAQFATSGSVQGGIFAYSLALAPELAAGGKFALLPETLHEPLRQRMVLTRQATPAAKQFYAWLQQPAARAVLRRYGFAVPGTQ